MNVPIRMLGIVTLIFWTILIGFIASAGYSMKDVKFDVGEPEFTANENGDVTFCLPFYVGNDGYFSLKALNITTIIYGEQGSELAKNSTFVATIERGQTVTILHNVTVSVRQLVEENQQLLLNDTILNAEAMVELEFAELMPVQLSTNFTLPWGAPFHSLMLDEPQYGGTRQSKIGVAVPLSFGNHAVFDIDGTISAGLYDNSGALLAESQTQVSVPARSTFNGELSFLAPLSIVSQSSVGGHVKLSFSTSLFEFGPVVIPYG